MAVATRDGLKQYALRSLGAPVLEINVDDDQLEDRIDEALEYFKLYHYDGIEKLYMKHKIRASYITINGTNAATFQLDDIVRGQTSGATAKVSHELNLVPASNQVVVRNVQGTFIVGETITATNTNATVVSCVLGEYDKKYIEIDDWVYGVTRVLPFSAASSSKNLFDLQYQLRLNDLYDLSSTSIVYYKTVMSHLAMLDLELNGYPLYRFNRLQGRLYLDINWETDIPLGDHVVVEAYRALNPADFNKIWNENWLKRYTTSQFKRQWGTNMKKFGGIQLPGGVTLNGDTIYQEAITEIKDLEDELMHKSAPLDFFMG